MREAPVKSLAPITFRITADVKPKPIVAEIKVGFMNNDSVMEIIYDVVSDSVHKARPLC